MKVQRCTLVDKKGGAMSVINMVLDRQEGKPWSLALIREMAIEQGNQRLAQAIVFGDDNDVREALTWEARKAGVAIDIIYFIWAVGWLSVN